MSGHNRPLSTLTKYNRTIKYWCQTRGRWRPSVPLPHFHFDNSRPSHPLKRSTIRQRQEIHRKDASRCVTRRRTSFGSYFLLVRKTPKTSLFSLLTREFVLTHFPFQQFTGKNYVNKNRGVYLQASNGKKKSAAVMEACFFGAGCTRPGCIYRHDRAALQQTPQSDEPCMAYLAGYCAFNARSCRKRHPPPAEAERLQRKYAQIRCRYGTQCQTEGCLYRHEALTEPVSLVDWVAQPSAAAAAAATQPLTPPVATTAPIPGTSWRPTPPPSTGGPTAFPSPSTTRPQPPTHRPVPPSMPPQRPHMPTTPPSSLRSSSAPSATSSDGGSGGFNIHAKEFVPGGGFR